tara:strand:- start:10790 stop:11236 length:447 start_codon:yes stop_codon:yes gene_type:complete
MKLKIILFSLSLFLIASVSFAQKKNAPKNIIRDNVSINKYHDKQELENMQKGELLNLYIERIEVLYKILPYIAFTTKPGVTMNDLGIPDSSDNRKALEDEFDSTDEFLKNSTKFQKQLLPYSDTTNLIAGILFYEDTLKALHEFGMYH